MAAKVIAKLKLAPLVPFWEDKNNGLVLVQGKILEVTEDMDIEPIRESVSKQILVLIEGTLPEKITTGNIEGADEIIALLNKKVDKEANKTLTTNDYTTKEKNKLASVEDGANNYIHPATHDASMINQDASHRFVTDKEKDSWNKKADAVENAPELSFNESGELEVKIGNTTKKFKSSDSTTTEPTNPDPDPGETTTDPFGEYEWKEVYQMTKATNKIDITGSKMIQEFTESGGDDGTFWDDYEACKYNLYAPRLTNKSGTPTTEADDNPNTLIPVYGMGQTKGSELTNISKSLENCEWKWDGEGYTYIDIGVVPTTLVVFYLIKTKEGKK